MIPGPPQDGALDAVAAMLQEIDSLESRVAGVIRRTFDQLYDGQRTGRFKWDQLYKTEKTHCGTLVEINLQREFNLNDGEILDYRLGDVEVDCKYSQRLGGWMIPPEARGQVCMLVWGEDTAAPCWSLGIVRATENFLNTGGNRDAKATLNEKGRNAIRWLFRRAVLPSNVLLQLDSTVVSQIMTPTSGQRRVDELFRKAQGRVVSRTVVATVAQQEDYMKRVRANGGSRTRLKTEGIIILGQYSSHVAIAANLGLPTPLHGDFVSARVACANGPGPGVTEISGGYWRIAGPSDAPSSAPDLPQV
jgi:hypothetical protein